MATEPASLEGANPADPGGAGLSAALSPTLRAQLVWAAMFPVALFGLLSMLVVAASLYNLTLSLTLQRNAAQAQAAAGELSSWMHDLNLGGVWPGARQGAGLPDADRLYLVNQNGDVLSNSGPGSFDASIRADLGLWGLVQNWQNRSVVQDSAALRDQAIDSFARVPGQSYGLLVEEPLGISLAEVFRYQAAVIAMLGLGIVLSAVLLWFMVGRTLRPILSLAREAGQVIPGSIFRPLRETGPVELRTLIHAFNQMVIRLAEQQGAVRQYAQKALLSQEEERQRLSHELHDGTVQDLVGLVQRMELCSNEMERDPAQGQRRLTELRALAKRSLDEVRRISNALRPSILQDLGLSAATRTLCLDLEQEMPGLRVDYQVTGTERRLPPDLELAVYRVVQESLSNVRKHAGHADRARVELLFSNANLTVVIEDAGPGLGPTDLRALVRQGHLGLAGMYERARLFGGRLETDSPPGGGTRVTLRQPYPPEVLPPTE